MPRSYHIAGEVMVSLKGGHPLMSLRRAQLGLASDSIEIIPKFYSKDILTDDFGPHCPVDIMRLLGEVEINMTLVHYDNEILEALMAINFGVIGTPLIDGVGFTNQGFLDNGVCGPAGRLMGRNIALGDTGNLFTSVNLQQTSPSAILDWRFHACSLNNMPGKIPIGVKHSLIELSFRAIPYETAAVSNSDPFVGTVPNPGEWASNGATIFDHVLDL